MTEENGELVVTLDDGKPKDPNQDILIRMAAKVIGPSAHDPMDTAVEMDARDFYECLNEVIRLRAALEAVAERSTTFSSVKQLQRLAQENIMPPGNIE